MKNAIFVWLLILIPLCYSCTKMWEDLDFDNGNEDDYELWQERVTPIVEGCMTDYEKAKAIYLWECDNIEYDYEFKIYHAAECWEQRKGVCQAYSELFVKLAYGCGLEAVIISGVAKKEQDEGHAWVRVNTKKGWILADPTWGVPSEYARIAWFDTAPEWAIFNHFPENSDNQMFTPPITKEQFHSLPNMYNPIGSKFGWNSREFLNYFLDHSDVTYPVIPYSCCPLVDRVKLIEAPYNGNLKVGETYTFKVQCLDTSLVIANYNSYANWFVNDSNSEDWEKEGDVYTKVFQPTSEWWTFEIFAHSKNQEGNNEILKYGIVE